VQALLQRAAESANLRKAERLLLWAFQEAPEHLTVLVALYRFYYYQQRLEEALRVGERAMQHSGRRLGFPAHWAALDMDYLAGGVMQSLGLVRFYLLALKGVGVLHLRLGRTAEALAMFEKLQKLDPGDQIGANSLVALAACALRPDEDPPGRVPLAPNGEAISRRVVAP
jgi:tetratricopeptide (TPR) repeat protein